MRSVFLKHSISDLYFLCVSTLLKFLDCKKILHIYKCKLLTGPVSTFFVCVNLHLWAEPIPDVSSSKQTSPRRSWDGKGPRRTLDQATEKRRQGHIQISNTYVLSYYCDPCTVWGTWVVTMSKTKIPALWSLHSGYGKKISNKQNK